MRNLITASIIESAISRIAGEKCALSLSYSHNDFAYLGLAELPSGRVYFGPFESRDLELSLNDFTERNLAKFRKAPVEVIEDW